MTILYDASLNVKPTTPQSFGRGILAARPAYRDISHTAADEAWYVANPSGPDFDALADEYVAQSRYEAGLCL